MKKLLVLVLALCMLSSSALAADAVPLNEMLPVVAEPLSVTIAVCPQGASINFSAESNWMCQFLEKYSGLNIEWMIIEPSTVDERIPMMLNSGSMPDAIIGKEFTVAEIVQYGVSDEVFRSINDLLDVMPNLSKVFDENPSWKAAVTATDGNIYGFPAFSNVWNYDTRMFVQSTWLEKLGIENPKTLAQFKDMLTAFKTGDANGNGIADEIPWTGSWTEDKNPRRFIMNAYGYIANNSDSVAVNYNGETPAVAFFPYEPAYKDYLTFMHELWTEGLIDPDMFTQATTQVQATVLEGVVGFSNMSAPYVYDPDHQDEWHSINALVDTEGKTPVWSAVNPIFSPATMVINADLDADKAAALAKLADCMYTIDWYVYATYGPEAGTEMDWNDQGHYFDEEANAIAYKTPDDMPSAWAHRITNLSIWNLPGFSMNGYAPFKIALGQDKPETAVGQLFKNGDVSRVDEVSQQQAYSPYYVEKLPNMFFTAEDQERLNELTMPLEDYVANMEAKFITGDASIENDYDSFIATLEQYGVKEYMEIYTRYYTAYKAN